MAPGDFMANTPLEFMLEGSSIVLDMMYVVPGAALPEPPEHDVALVAIDELDETAPVLREIAALVKSWPRPVINAPDRIARLTRAGTWEILKSAPHVVMPKNARIDRKTFARIAAGSVAIEFYSRRRSISDHRAAVLVAGRHGLGETGQCIGHRALSA